MGLKFGRWRSDTLPFFLQAVPFGFAAQTGTGQAWLLAFGLAAPINLWAWLMALRRRRAIADTPTSKVASAAQGFAELVGRAQAVDGVELVSPVTHLPCLWYRYVVEKRNNGEWKQTDHGESELPFLLDDGTGQCEIQPQGADIHTNHKETRTQGDERTTEYVLLKGDPLYALGDFRSDNGEHVRLDRRQDVGDLLGEWKDDPAALHRRFDLDRNGAIDDQEWQRARQAAEAEVDQRHRDIRTRPLRHVLAKPGRGTPFIISNHPPEKLGRRYAWLGAAHLALMLAALAGVGWAMNLPG